MKDREKGEMSFREHQSKIKEELTGRIKNSLSGFLSVCLVGLLALLQILFIIILFRHLSFT